MEGDHMRYVEQLESRRLLAAFAAASVAQLVSDIDAANAAGGANTITLAAGTTFNLNAANNSVHGPTALPVIAAGNDLTILGNADTLQRSTAKGTPGFRFFDVAAGASLTLNGLTLSGGLALDSYSEGVAKGGGIRSQGTLSLNGVTVQNCTAQGEYLGEPAFGGGIFSSGILTVTGSTIRNNQALGTDGTSFGLTAGAGGSAAGGGLYVSGTSASLTNVTVDSNVARGGNGGSGGTAHVFNAVFHFPGGLGGGAAGGGIYAGASTVELRGMNITRNAVKGGAGGNSPKGLPKGADGPGVGGGLYIYPGALVGLDPFTEANTRSNSASTSDNDIFGSFTLLP
jgi:hypothetical protein